MCPKLERKCFHEKKFFSSKIGPKFETFLSKNKSFFKKLVQNTFFQLEAQGPGTQLTADNHEISADSRQS
jgi:hypothetical protein